jgi:KTSC domain
MIVSVKGAYVRYCELPPATFNALMAAPSMARFYHVKLNDPGSSGPFACKIPPAPNY